MNWGAERTEFFASNYFGGMALAHPERWKLFSGDKNSAALIKAVPTPHRVAVVVSGGSGGGPLFPGYVGEGLADGAVEGGLNAAPNAYCLYEVGKYLGREKGVLFLYNNFAGDFLNNDMAQELLEMDGVQVASLPATDDIASAIGEPRQNRGGRCGIAFLIKLAGQCAQRGMSLPQIRELLARANKRLGTLNMQADFAKGEITYGNGFSGEPAFRTETHTDFAKAVEMAMDLLLEDLSPQSGEKLLLLVNRMRYTGYSDGYLAGKTALEYVTKRHPVAQLRVANFSNITDAYGYNFSVLCADDEMMNLLKEPVHSDCFIL